MASTYCSISLSGSWATEAGVEARARQDGSWTEDQRCHHFGLQEHHSDPSGLCRNFSPIFHEMFNDCFHRVNLTHWVEKGKERSKVKGMLDQWMELLSESGAFEVSHVKHPTEDPWTKYVHINLVDRELELELAQTKLALVETECKKRTKTWRINSQSLRCRELPCHLALTFLKSSGFQGKLQWASVQHLVVQDSQFHQGSGWWGLESCFYSCISYLWPHSGILSQDPKEVQWKRQKAWRSPARNKQLGAMENDHKNNDDRLSHCFSFAENDS